MEQEEGILKPTLNYGAMLGTLLIVVSLVFYLLNIKDTTVSSIITYIALAGGVFYAQNHYKLNYTDGFMSYGKALGIGALTCLFAGFINAIYSYVFIKFVDASMIDVAMEQAYSDMQERGMDEEQIDQAMQMSSMFMTPGVMAFFAFIGTALIGFLESLVISIFTKKDNPEELA